MSNFPTEMISSGSTSRTCERLVYQRIIALEWKEEWRLRKGRSDHRTSFPSHKHKYTVRGRIERWKEEREGEGKRGREGEGRTEIQTYHFNVVYELW